IDGVLLEATEAGFRPTDHAADAWPEQHHGAVERERQGLVADASGPVGRERGQEARVGWPPILSGRDPGRQADALIQIPVALKALDRDGYVIRDLRLTGRIRGEI